MLSQNAFEVWCQKLALSEQAEASLSQIRSSPPSRLVRSAAGNVSGRYPSKKMGCAIQFESHRGELAAIYQFEHDPMVLEFYDQPPALKLTYPSKKGRQVGVLHTPDFFVIREDGGGWIECKMEDHLLQLTEQMPHRYVHTPDGRWSCPPGEAYAQRLGFFYHIQSSAQIDWVHQRNLRFLEDYLRFSRPPLETSVVDAVRTLVMGKPGLTLLELLEALQTGMADDIYFLIATDQVYVDLSQTPLADPEHVQVFVDRAQAQAYATLSQSCLHLVPCSSSSTLTPGTVLWWDGNPWRALNLGETIVTLLSPENHLLDVPIAVFDALITQRKVTIATASRDDEARGAEEHERLTKASPKHLEIATQRYKLLGRALPQADGATVAPRPLQRWQAQFRTAEVVHGHGFTGLIPRWSNSGNRLPRLSQSTEQLLEKYITDHYETLQQRSKHAVYLLLEREERREQYSRSQLQNDLARASKSAHVINKP